MIAKKNVLEYKELLEKSFKVLWPHNKSIIISSKIWAKLRQNGLIIEDRDLEIGAMCIANNIPLWTKNLKHFERLKTFGLELVDVSIDFKE